MPVGCGGLLMTGGLYAFKRADSPRVTRSANILRDSPAVGEKRLANAEYNSYLTNSANSENEISNTLDEPVAKLSKEYTKLDSNQGVTMVCVKLGPEHLVHQSDGNYGVPPAIELSITRNENGQDSDVNYVHIFNKWSGLGESKLLAPEVSVSNGSLTRI